MTLDTHKKAILNIKYVFYSIVNKKNLINFFYLRLITGSISNIDDTEYHCNKTVVRKIISGVVGAASSVTSIQVANLLRLFRIPQVHIMTRILLFEYLFLCIYESMTKKNTR